jgi:hypothetical protein
MSRQLVACSGLVLSALFAAQTQALDWHEPWSERHDSSAAARAPDEYAWRLFVAINWPADPTTRAADRSAPLGAQRPVVWETWQNANEVYLDGGADPGPWAAGRSAPHEGAVDRFETLSRAQFGQPHRIVNGRVVPLTDPIGADHGLTEIRLNRKAFEYIRAWQLYNVEGQLEAYRRQAAVSFPAGAMEIKARWRPITNAEQQRYYTLRVTLQDGTIQLYGLTALNLMTKDLPTWLWATFEHVDNPSQPGGEPWLLPSRDTFACRHAAADCNRAPRGIGLEGTIWENYRLRGTLTRFTDERGAPVLLANSQLEAGFQRSSSCVTCHSRASIGLVDGRPQRLGVFEPQADAGSDQGPHRGFSGLPKAEWFYREGVAGDRQRMYIPLDFVWSLSKAQSTGSLRTPQ